MGSLVCIFFPRTFILLYFHLRSQLTNIPSTSWAFNLANRVRHNKRNNSYESLPEEEQLSLPPIRQRVRIRSVCNKIMCSKCLQIPLHHPSHIWRMRAVHCTGRLLSSCFIQNDILLWPGHDTLHCIEGAKGHAEEHMEPFIKRHRVVVGVCGKVLSVVRLKSSLLKVQLALCLLKSGKESKLFQCGRKTWEMSCAWTVRGLHCLYWSYISPDKVCKALT